MSVCFFWQGRDEFGDLFSGPSEESHEQYTDYESSDDTSARDGCPGVTDESKARPGHGRELWKKKRQKKLHRLRAQPRIIMTKITKN